MEGREVLGVSGKRRESELGEKEETGVTAVCGTEGKRKDMSCCTFGGNEERGEGSVVIVIELENAVATDGIVDEEKEGVEATDDEKEGVEATDEEKEEDEEDVEPIEEKAAGGRSKEREEDEKDEVAGAAEPP